MGDRGGSLSRELIDEAQSLTAPPATDADDATADRMWEYIAIANSAVSDSDKTSRLTALLRQEENHSLLECFRGEGQWHGHGVEAHFEGAPNWKVVIAKIAGGFDRGGDKGSRGGDRWGEPRGGGGGGGGGGGSFGGGGRDFGGGCAEEDLMKNNQLGIVVRTCSGSLVVPAGNGSFLSVSDLKVRVFLAAVFAARWCSAERRKHRIVPVQISCRSVACAGEG